MKPIISIIIVNYKGRYFIENCLNSVLQEKNRAFEIIVVDNNSKDGSIELIKDKFTKYKNFQLLSLNTNVGAAEGRNIGVNKARGKYLFFLDYDTEVKKGWYDEIVNFFAGYKNAAAVQAKLLKLGTNRYDYAGDYIGPFGFLIERAQGAKDQGQFDKPEKIFSLRGAAMIIRCDIFNQIGRFDSDFEYMWEEPDLTWRIWLSGHEVYFLPSITVGHAYVTPTKNHEYYTSANVTFKGCRNSITALIKNLQTKNLFVILPAHILCLLIISALFLVTGQIKKAFDVIHAILWNLKNMKVTLKKRALIQKKRQINDDKLFATVGAKRGVVYYAGKLQAYITGGSYL